MRFTFAAVLALGIAVRSSDAFLPPALKLRMSGMHMSSKYTALYQTSDDENIDGDEGNDDDGQGSSRIRDMMKLAKEQSSSSAMEALPRAVENPFLNPPPPPPPTPGALSVEEQARMFREMMAGNQSPATPQQLPPVTRTAKTDEAGRPVGRNPDADKITNTSDLYFAQLKRDSTVRTLGRIRGDDGVSEAIFEDTGITELSGLLKENPFLKGKKEDERSLLDNLPDEVVAPYFQSNNLSEEEKSVSGISYKQRLMERRQKTSGGSSTPVSASQVEATPIQPPQEQKPETMVLETNTPPPVPSVPEVVPQASTKPPLPPPPPPPQQKPETVALETNTPLPAPLEVEVVPQASTKPPLPPPQQQQPPTLDLEETPRPFTVTSSNDVRKQNLRTLMGLVLKHRGGPSFGKGRLKGQDVDLFEGLVKEITNMLQDEAKVAQADLPIPTTAIVEENPTVVTESASGDAESTNIDSTIACIEGAITMYKNSPPAIRESVLATLRAALISAVDTCNIALAPQPAPPVTASADASIDSMVVCIEGAATMYKNCPPALKESVLVTLRMALMSAVETCNIILSQGQLTPPVAAVESAPVQQPTASIATTSSQVSPSPIPAGMDDNSKALEKAYEKIESASGNGKLGLRSDLTSSEATELADELVGMGKILMEELDTGIPDPEPEIDSLEAPDNAVGEESSVTSRYQQMLAKARAEKAKS